MESTSASTPSPTPPPNFRAGLAVLIGRTNAGKSTLLNALVERKVSIVSSKPQTTRHPIHGVLHRPAGQIVFVDTPGFFQTHRSALVEKLHARTRAALDGIDVVVHVADPSRPLGAEDEMVLTSLSTVAQPKILCLAKSDLRSRAHLAAWREHAAHYAVVLEVSAVSRRHLEDLVTAILNRLPVAPPLYPESEFTNARREFQIAEIIREKIYILTGDEVPYRTAVKVDAIEERPSRAGDDLFEVHAEIQVAHVRYKSMLIGAKGRMVRNIGASARKDLETLLGRKVFLKLRVAVDDKLPE
ncbi:MAG: GTPase Era [Verrucomicrobiales bacterium]|nr:GTPase Era [Verrucomicrobiales bacterium]